jgi:hypothetical protein
MFTIIEHSSERRDAIGEECILRGGIPIDSRIPIDRKGPRVRAPRQVAQIVGRGRVEMLPQRVDRLSARILLCDRIVENGTRRVEATISEFGQHRTSSDASSVEKAYGATLADVTKGVLVCQ